MEVKMNVVIRKSGLFYEVFDNDAEIFHYLFNYKIVNHRVGFPNNAINKVINILENKEISYEVIGEDSKHDFKDKNQYNLYIAKSKNKIELNDKIEKILKLLETFDEKKLWEILDRIIKLIEEYEK